MRWYQYEDHEPRLIIQDHIINAAAVIRCELMISLTIETTNIRMKFALIMNLPFILATSLKPVTSFELF